MATFTWTVLAVDVSTEILAGHNDIVTVVYWQCVGEQDGFTAALERNTKVECDPNNFTSFDQLTENQVMGWVWNTEAYKPKDQPAVTVKDATEREIQQMLDVKITPPVISPALPWVN